MNLTKSYSELNRSEFIGDYFQLWSDTHLVLAAAAGQFICGACVHHNKGACHQSSGMAQLCIFKGKVQAKI